MILYLLEHEKMSLTAVQTLIWEQSGLLGVSGVSSDMRELLVGGGLAAKEAIDLFVYRIRRELGSMAAALGGLDRLVFSGGIGEHAIEIRVRICDDARWLGIALDAPANVAGRPCISLSGSAASVSVIPTGENLMIARQTRRLLDAAQSR